MAKKTTKVATGRSAMGFRNLAKGIFPGMRQHRDDVYHWCAVVASLATAVFIPYQIYNNWSSASTTSQGRQQVIELQKELAALQREHQSTLDRLSSQLLFETETEEASLLVASEFCALRVNTHTSSEVSSLITKSTTDIRNIGELEWGTVGLIVDKVLEESKPTQALFARTSLDKKSFRFGVVYKLFIEQRSLFPESSFWNIQNQESKKTF